MRVFGTSLALKLAAPAAFLLALANLASVGCSSSERPAAGTDGTGASGIGGGSGDGGGSNDASADGGVADGSTADADVDAAPLNCLGDTIDGGAAACPSGPCSAACANVLAHYRPAVANAAVACIAAMPSCEVPLEIVPCVDQAIAQACPVSTSPSFCTPIVSAVQACEADPSGSAISQQGCEGFANALTTSGRTTYASCLEATVTAGTCKTESVKCADDIRQ